MEKEEPDAQELTFRPNTGRPEAEAVRSHNQFLRDQEAYVQKRRKKQQDLEEQIKQKEQSDKPILHNPSQKKGKGEKPVHHRLYTQGQLLLAKRQQQEIARESEISQPLKGAAPSKPRSASQADQPENKNTLN